MCDYVCNMRAGGYSFVATEETELSVYDVAMVNLFCQVMLHGTFLQLGNTMHVSLISPAVA